MNKAIFFDRDGTLNHDSGYLCNPDDVVLLTGVRETLRNFKDAGYMLFLFTNQSGVARGYFGMDAVEAVNGRLFELLGGNIFDGICIATEDPDNDGPDSYRKPSPRYILEMIEKFDLDRSKSFIVGDRKRDLEAGIRAGINAIRVFEDIDDEKSAAYCREHSLPSVSIFSEIAGLIASAEAENADFKNTP